MKKAAAELIKFLREDVIECDYHSGCGKCDKLTDLTNAFESSLSLVAGEEEVILQCQKCGATATAFYAKKYGCCTAPFPQRTSGICGGEFIVQAKVNGDKKPMTATTEENMLQESLVDFIRTTYDWYIKHSPSDGVIPTILQKWDEIKLNDQLPVSDNGETIKGWIASKYVSIYLKGKKDNPANHLYSLFIKAIDEYVRKLLKGNQKKEV